SLISVVFVVVRKEREKGKNLCMLRRKSLKRNPAYVSATTSHVAATRFCSSFNSTVHSSPIIREKSRTGNKIHMPLTMASKFLLTLAICRLIITVGLMMDPTELLNLGVEGQLSVEASDVETASTDFGGMTRTEPLAVLHPASAEDIARLIRAAYESANGLTVSARGHGHSTNGQAQTRNGVVVEMSRMSGLGVNPAWRPRVNEKQQYVDVWGGELWIDVLKSSLEFGLAPKSWTDYLYLSVGGTLSNGGISGQAFNHGPQISNLHELDVVTGRGELLTCSEEQNQELFHAVLGGLGQFGIITRARVRWIRVLYSNFSAFTRDQEYLISLHAQAATQKFDYVEGFVIVDEGLINNWRSSFFSPRNPVKISSLGANGGVLYCLEITKNYDDSTADTVDQVVEGLLKKLDYIPASVFTTDIPYVDFLDRVHKAELKLRAKGLWDVPHPWLNLFVPKSRISDFDKGVFKGILGKKTSGPILIYPMNKNKWDDRTSVITPDEDVFYLVALLRSALDTSDETQTLDYLTNQNRRILKFCEDAKINIKQYLPHYTTQQHWMDHFGDKWDRFERRKLAYDPRHILATGQRIFEPNFNIASQR
ncbi:Cytokinin dehydrogenase 1, FAD/cytokinin binding domain, partial [Dillenia turbinata]